MADTGGKGRKRAAAAPEKYPELDPLRERVERAKLRQALQKATARDPMEAPKLGLDLAQDTSTNADNGTALAAVLVARASQILGDDIAELVLDAVVEDLPEGAPRKATLLVTTDREPWRRRETRLVLGRGLDELTSRLEEVLRKNDVEPEPATPLSPPPAGGEFDMGSVAAITASFIAGPALVPLVASIAGEAINAFSKLTAHQYTTSQAAVDAAGIGLDVTLARYLRSKQHQEEAFDVGVDRFGVATDGGLVQQFARLADLMQQVADHDAGTSVDIAQKKAAVTTQEELVSALDDQVLEVTKNLPNEKLKDTLDQLRSTRLTEGAELEARRGALGELAVGHDAALSVLEAASSFVKDALTFADDGSCPIIDAARADAFTDAVHPYYVHVRPVGAGVDTLEDLKLGRDYWSALAGISAEWAVVRPDGSVVNSGVLSALQQSRTCLGKGYRALTSENVDYIGRSRRT